MRSGRFTVGIEGSFIIPPRMFSSWIWISQVNTIINNLSIVQFYSIPRQLLLPVVIEIQLMMNTLVNTITCFWLSLEQNLGSPKSLPQNPPKLYSFIDRSFTGSCLWLAIKFCQIFKCWIKFVLLLDSLFKCQMNAMII